MKTPSTVLENSSVIGNTKKGHHYWVGKLNNGIDYFAGQTFKCNKPGLLKSISIYSEMIVGETHANLCVFEFAEQNHQWNTKMVEHKLNLNTSNKHQWITFDMQNMVMDSNKQYGFKLSCNHGGMMAIAEGPWDEKDPYPDGEQWIGSSENPDGKFYRKFDLAFVAEIQHNHL